MQWHQTRGRCCYTAILPSWNGWRSGSKAGRCGSCRPTFRLPFLRARLSSQYPADWSILQSYGLEAGVLQMTPPPAGMPSWSRNARAILHTVHMGLWELLVAGAAFLFLLITHIIEDRAMAEVAQDENILAGKW